MAIFIQIFIKNGKKYPLFWVQKKSKKNPILANFDQIPLYFDQNFLKKSEKIDFLAFLDWYLQKNGQILTKLV